MSLKSVITLLAALLSGAVSIAQTYEQVTGNRSVYIWAEGTGSTFREADKAALALISDQISVEVSSKLTVAQNRESQNRKTIATASFQSVVDTYSQATLTMCQRIVVKNGPKEYRILRFIQKSEIEKAFQEREAKAKEMVRIGERAEQELKIGDALRYYYWSQILVSTLLHPGETTYTDENGRTQTLSVWLPIKIRTILEGIQITFAGFSDEDKIYGKLRFNYAGRPVTSLDYTYWDGIDWSYTCTAKNGLGAFELRSGSAIPSINVKIEYAYENETQIDREIESILAAVTAVNYNEAYHNNISINDLTTSPDAAQTGKLASVQDSVKTDYSSVLASAHPVVTNTSASFAVTDNKAYYQSCIERICKAINQRDYSSVRNCFTQEGYNLFTMLINYGKAVVLDGSASDCLSFNGEVFCRSIPMTFSFSNNQVKFVENVVFTFNSDRKISNISFAIEDITLSDILSKSQWEDNAKMILINFLENYKTAFALKRLDYLKSIFSDDALIITGRVVKRAVVENQILGKAEYVEYNRQTKAQYINNLQYSFRSKDYINIKFANIKVLKMGKGDSIYSIQIKQDYFSSNYGDSGYLFLLVDASDYQRPIIHIRTWQPEPDPDFGLFGPYYF